MASASEAQSKRTSVTRYATVSDLISARRPNLPVYALFSTEFAKAVREFLESFPGETMYAVKANHAGPVLDEIHAAGIRHFDVASLAEVKLIRERFPEAKQSFMAPIRIRGAAGEAFRTYGVRDFALDSEVELLTILRETGALHDRRLASELTLYVRLALSVEGAVIELSSKFGATVADAAELMKAIARAGARPALTFHVGSLCLNPDAYTKALEICGETIKRSGITPAAIDMGGGFPAPYLHIEVPPMQVYFDAIHKGLKALNLPPECKLYCEPGRALCAEGVALVTQVTFRRGDALYINDGIYGSLNEYVVKNWPARYPTRVYTPAPDGKIAEKKGATSLFKMYGPTCDTLDVLPMQLELPASTSPGDWIEFAMLGAYSCALRTAFNGFFPDTFAAVDTV